jgi:hypothetical protein
MVFISDYPSIIEAMIRQRRVASSYTLAIPPKRERQVREAHGIPPEERFLLLFGSKRGCLVLTNEAFYDVPFGKLANRTPYSDFLLFRKFVLNPLAYSFQEGQQFKGQQMKSFLAIFDRIMACTLAAQSSPPTDKDQQYHFQCMLPSQSFGTGLSEALQGVFTMSATDSANPLTCVLKQNRLALYQEVINHDFVECISEATDQIVRATYREVKWEEHRHGVIRRSIGFGMGLGGGGCIVLSMIGRLAGTLRHPMSFWETFLIAFIMALLGGVSGYIFAAIKMRLMASKRPVGAISHVEFTAMLRDKGVAVILNVAPEERANALNAMHAAKWEL